MGKDSNLKTEKAQVVLFKQAGDFYYKKGVKAYQNHDLVKAKKYFQRAHRLKPDDTSIMLEYSVVLTELGEYQQSNQLLLDIDVENDAIECHYLIANNYAHLGLFQESAKYAQRYLEADPEGEFKEETEELLDLLSIEVEDDDVESAYEDDLIIKQEEAKRLLEQAKFEEAITVLNGVIEDYPEFWSAYNNLALAHFYLDHLEEAMSILEMVLEKNPGNIHALCNQLIFHYYCQQTEEMNALAEQLAPITPMIVEHRYKLGATFALIGKYEYAYRCLRLLYKHGYEGDASFYYWLSSAAYFTGNEKFAKSIWKRVLEEMPDKEGLEPWNRVDAKIQLDPVALKQQIHENLSSDKQSEQLCGLFLTSFLNGDLSHLLSPYEAEMKDDQLLTAVYKELMARGTHPGAEVVQYLGLTESEDSYFLLSFWSHLYVKAFKKEIPIVNAKGWAAAINYMWRKYVKEKKVSQAEIADSYGMSTSTIGKYVKVVNSLLE
ncbi:tetratricopeptide repeat protein [Priestia koreensis]|uniref:tetratricopeptide repeat protein n=1 Tax=Priestia koreensis TaxID=284581 RepID=UPI001F5AF75E|nr:tetratricopeptide repeat protein [Priestia koreensis]MCM3004522.1 tetratricopeptide repeat protein [Priestia koreensis]UNL84735.1 tetratricopeptide repeat protein [Priestia koreensis]